MFSSQNSQVSSAANYIEDVFSTYLYTGNGSTQTITNGIDLAGKGGLVWLKSRTNPPSPYDDFHRAVDTVRGTNSVLYPNSTSVADPFSYVLTSFNSNGFTIGNGTYDVNKSGYNYASWTFREQPKFFDVVTYTGTGGGPSSVAHALGSVPGCVIIKSTSRAGNWVTVSRMSTGNYAAFVGSSSGLQSTAAADSTTYNLVGAGAVTSTTFDPSWWNANGTVGAVNNICDNGVTYVAYLFAHDAGGFGLTGTDNVISCGSWTNTGSNVTINLGYEPQYILMKATNSASDWYVWDTMRGLVVDGSSGTGDKALYPNLTSAEVGTFGIEPTATGFIASGLWTVATWMYIAIRRGPMKTPTTGTSVFSPIVRPGSGANSFTTGFPVDLSITVSTDVSNQRFAFDRLRGSGDSAGTVSKYSYLNTDTAEFSQTGFGIGLANNTGFSQNWWSSQNTIFWSFRRAPGFFDVVCYTGTGSLLTVNHNLGVAPELVINKTRSTTWPWMVTYNFTSTTTDIIFLNSDAAKNSTQSYGTGAVQYSSQPTATSLFLATNATINTASQTQVAYLFATCPGVSKVGSYTGNGTSLTIPCGFTAGARFVMIKCTSTTGDWYVWDTARGIVSGNDPHLSLNTTAAEVTTDDTIDPDNSGFIVNQVAATNVNVSSATYIFLAIA